MIDYTATHGLFRVLIFSKYDITCYGGSMSGSMKTSSLPITYREVSLSDAGWLF